MLNEEEKRKFVNSFKDVKTNDDIYKSMPLEQYLNFASDNADIFLTISNLFSNLTSAIRVHINETKTAMRNYNATVVSDLPDEEILKFKKRVSIITAHNTSLRVMLFSVINKVRDDSFEILSLLTMGDFTNSIKYEFAKVTSEKLNIPLEDINISYDDLKDYYKEPPQLKR